MASSPASQQSVHGGTQATRAIASGLGVIVGVSGVDHGFFEVLHGNAPTAGLFVQSIGPAQRMWLYGTEDAFTLIPNFLATGIAALLVGVAVIIWSIWFIDRRRGNRVFLALGVLLFLVGGGVAQVAAVILCWAVASRIGRPPALRRGPRHSVGEVRWLAARWPVFLIAALALDAVALEIAICGFVPGVTDPIQVQSVCWSALVLMLVAVLLAIAGGFEADAAFAASSGGAQRDEAAVPSSVAQ